MKTTVIIFSFIATFFFQTKSIFAQITLEATYDYSYQDLSIVNLEDIGMKYMVRQKFYNPGGKLLRFYNLDHSVYNTVDMNSFPVGFGITSTGYQILYVSQYLFDLDAEIEFMYLSSSSIPYTGIYNIDGTLLQGFDSLGAYVTPNFHTYQYPIYNTPLGTKLILSNNVSSYSNVYSLQGVFTPLLTPFSEDVKNFNIYPNPSTSFTIVDYQLPEGVTDAYLNITDLNGNVLKTYRVDAYQKNILVNNDEIGSGTYLYTISQNNKILVSKKIEILKQ